MKKAYGISFLFLALGLPQISIASEIERAMKLSKYAASEKQKVALFKAANKTKETIDNARWAMIQAQSQFLAKKIVADEFDEIIYDQSAVIAQANQNLKQTINEIVAGGEVRQVQESYWVQVKRSWMKWYGYEVTPEQKKARQDLDTLIQQKEIIKDDYNLMKLDDGLTPNQKGVLQIRYLAIFTRIDNEIAAFLQKEYSKWSMLRKILVAGAIAAAGTVVGLLFTNKIWVTAER